MLGLDATIECDARRPCALLIYNSCVAQHKRTTFSCPQKDVKSTIATTTKSSPRLRRHGLEGCQSAGMPCNYINSQRATIHIVRTASTSSIMKYDKKKSIIRRAGQQRIHFLTSIIVVVAFISSSCPTHLASVSTARPVSFRRRDRTRGNTINRPTRIYSSTSCNAVTNQVFQNRAQTNATICLAQS